MDNIAVIHFLQKGIKMNKEVAKKGDWVQIECCILEPKERAPQIPDETAIVPLVMKTKGFLRSDAATGDKVTVETLAGRELEGVLTEILPGYHHDFGEPQPELLHIGTELRQILRETGYQSGSCRGDENGK